MSNASSVGLVVASNTTVLSSETSGAVFHVTKDSSQDVVIRLITVSFDPDKVECGSPAPSLWKRDSLAESIIAFAGI